MRSQPGNLVAPPTPPQLLPFPSFHLAPSQCAHPFPPPYPLTDRALLGAENRKTTRLQLQRGCKTKVDKSLEEKHKRIAWRNRNELKGT